MYDINIYYVMLSVEWSPIHTSQHVNQTVGPVDLRDLELKLPHDINSYEMLKYVNVFCKVIIIYIVITVDQQTSIATYYL